MKNKREAKRYNKKLIIGIIFTTLVLILGTSYAFFTLTLRAEKELSVTTGVLQIDYKDQNTISLENAYPMSDQKGMNTSAYEFSIKNAGNIKVLYDVSLEEGENSDLNYTWLKYSLKRNEEEWSIPKKLTSLKLEEGFELEPNKTDIYQLRVWIDESVGNEAQGKIFIARVVVSSVQSNASTTDVTPPVIKLSGSLSESIEQNKSYTDPGVESVVDDRDTLDKDNVQVSYQYFDGEMTTEVEDIDTSRVGVYYIYYKAKDTSGNEGKVIRSVNVYKKDTTPPVIRLNGKSVITIEKGNSYQELGATASKSGEDLTSRIVTVGEVNTKRTGSYEVKYLITDEEGNTASIVRVVHVVYVSESSTSDLKIDLSKNPNDQIKLEGENLGEIRYTSSDESIASVDSGGNVTGHVPGEATIKITTSTGVEKEVIVKVVKTVTATYVKQGSGVTAIGKTSDACEITTKGGSCEVMAPAITVSSGYTAVGWNTSSDATSGTEANAKITLSSDTTYYSISYKNAVTYTVNFNANGNTINATSKSCTIDKAYNNASQGTSCSITTPVITAPSATPTVVGYNEDKTAKTSQVGSNASLTVASSMNGKTYYAITKKGAVTRSVTYTKGSGVSSIGKNSDSCSIGETYNGTTQGTTCSVSLPSITSSTGYNTGFWSTSNTATSGSAAGTSISLSSNATYYARALDTTKPVWSLVSTNPSSGTISPSDTLTITFKGTDTSGSVTSTLAAGNITVKSGSTTVSPTTKTLSSATNVTDGKQYTLTLSGINTEGVISITIAASTLKDSSNNENNAATLTTGVTIKKPATDTLLNKTNPTTLTYNNATDTQKHEMFTFTHGAGDGEWSKEELTDYRYIGTTPNNYVTFNDETWRIIGIFTVKDENGKKEKRIKIIRNEAIGKYSWDNVGEYGVNDWRTSALQKVLNSGPYYNRTSGSCPSGSNGMTTTCNFSSSGLTLDAKSMIGKTEWYLGRWNTSAMTASEFYEYERGLTWDSGTPTIWVGEVGLMYPSDYGYAATRSQCLITNLNEYSPNCKNSDWLYNSSLDQWTIFSASDNRQTVFTACSSGFVTYDNAVDKYNDVRPSVYLKSSVIISSGDGSEGNPYQLLIN